jgi:transcriptional regulator with XRE-family HTH domain
MQRLGAEIRRRRECLGISQSEVARLGETDRLFLGLVERGEKNASIETLERISRVLNVRLSTLVAKAERGNS